MRFHIHDAVIGDAVFESQVGHRTARKAGGILANEVAKNPLEVVFNDGLDGVASGSCAFGSVGGEKICLFVQQVTDFAFDALA